MSLTRRELLIGAAVAVRFGAALQPAAAATLRRYEYVLPDGHLYVYDLDREFRLVKHVKLPLTRYGVRGVCGSTATGMLYVSYGGDGGDNGPGAMLKYDLRRDRVLWSRSYPFGIDSPAVSPDGRRVYMPDGALSADGTWYVLDGGDGRVLGRIEGGKAPHNTILSRDGRRLYMGGRDHDELEVADTRSGRTLRKVGPLRSGVRPFTVNGRETLAFTTATGFLGFQVGSLATGKVLHTVDLADHGFAWDRTAFDESYCPSHGISMSPGEQTVWVIDGPNEHVHVFEIGGLPGRAPRLATSVKVSSLREPERPCAYACTKDGWLSHSRDGRFVLVGDAGDVIDTHTRHVVAHLDPLANTRKYVEVQFDARGRVAWAASSRASVGQVIGRK